MNGISTLNRLSKAAAQKLANRFVGFYKQLPESVQEWLNLQIKLDEDASAHELMDAYRQRCPNLSPTDARIVAFMLEKNVANTESNMFERSYQAPNQWILFPFRCMAQYGRVAVMQVYDAEALAVLAAEI